MPFNDQLLMAKVAGFWLLGQLLHWHRREDKPEWWSSFQRLRMTDEELVEDSEAIGELDYSQIVEELPKPYVHRYSFDPAQEHHKIAVGKDTVDPRTGKSAGVVVGLDAVLGTIDLKRAKSSAVPHPRSLLPSGPIDNAAMRAALERVAMWVIENGIGTPGSYQAARDLLLNLPPRLGSQSAGPLRSDHESALEAARRLVAALDDSYLPIQGPPGSGKTFIGARVIVNLVRAGKKVGGEFVA